MYSPNATNKLILDSALSHIESVPYKVSLRWVFYRLLQDGLYSSKEDYSKWKALSSTARKKFYSRWYPATLSDDTRAIIYRNGGYENEETLRENYFEDLMKNTPVFLDHFTEQKEMVFICFEARAMADQFRYYTERINLVPFGGDPSIPLKWEIAKSIESWRRYYEKPIRLLYFGDYDPKGKQISISALKDIIEWCDAFFEVTNCGLTRKQAIDYNIPENPEKPGEYQWEALDDTGAADIIREAVYSFVDAEIMNSVEEKEAALTIEFREKLEKAL